MAAVCNGPDLRANCSQGWETALENKKAIPEEFLSMTVMGTGIFEQLHMLMTFEDTLMNLLLYPEEIHEIIEVVTDFRLEYMKLGETPILFRGSETGSKRLLEVKHTTMARDMTVGREGNHILAFALPIMGGLVLQQLYNTVDSVVVGRTLGATALGAVGTCAALTMFAVSFAVGLTNGSGVIFTQLFGAKHMEDLRKNLSTAYILLTVLGLLISVLGFCFARPLLKALAAPEEILDMATGYFRIYCIGLVFQFVYNVAAGALRSVGDSKATLYFLCISSVVNIVLDIVFVVVFHWGVEGTAIATVIAQGGERRGEPRIYEQKI